MDSIGLWLRCLLPPFLRPTTNENKKNGQQRKKDDVRVSGGQILDQQQTYKDVWPYKCGSWFISYYLFSLLARNLPMQEIV